MCDANKIGALSFGQNLMSQKAQAQAQYDSELQTYYNKQAAWEINKMQADDTAIMRKANARLQLQQLDEAQRQANESAAEEKSGIAREMAKAKATAELVAAESGVSGNSAERILTDLKTTEQQRYAAVESTRSNAITQYQMEKQGVVQSTEMSPIYSAIGAAPKYQGNNVMSYLSAALSGLSTYAGYKFSEPKAATKQVTQVSQTSSTTATRNPCYVCP